jgi:hypothetical protein
MEEAQRQLKHRAGALWRETPVRELKPIAIYRFGLDTGG